jgi:hypothetical protein
VPFSPPGKVPFQPLEVPRRIGNTHPSAAVTFETPPKPEVSPARNDRCSWAAKGTRVEKLSLSSILVESVLRAETLFIGDPEVLPYLEASGDACGLVDTSAGQALVLRNRGAPTEASGFGGVFVWVAGSSAADDVRVSLSIDALDEPLLPLGTIDCPSGRLVVGAPDAVAAWGEGIEPADGLAAQARAYTPDRRHCGLIVVARVLPGPRQVFATDGLDALVVDCTPQPAIQEELLLAG